MSSRRAAPFSWFWLVGVLLLSDADVLFDSGVTEAGLKRSFLHELNQLPAAERQRLTGFPFTEDAIAAATPEQHATLTRVMRRAVSALSAQRRRAAHRREATR